jgi:hypothetical protein
MIENKSEQTFLLIVMYFLLIVMYFLLIVMYFLLIAMYLPINSYVYIVTPVLLNKTV